MPKIQSIGAIIYDESTRRVLLVHGKDSKKWGFPKGHMIKGESLEMTAKREIKEETGIEFPLEVFLRKYHCVINNQYYFLVPWAEKFVPCKIEDTKEIDACGWFDLSFIYTLTRDEINAGLSKFRQICKYLISSTA